ncbi:MAG TPA: ATP-binding cassette domain-containing protein, partial [Myxococcota bacterium]|nr:ATP-binding cassette domain-containing protein [Myxococcota bacterium]
MSRLHVRLCTPLDRFALDVDFRSDARALGLFGPSGAGKSTVLEAVAGWRAVERGRIEFAGRVWLDTAGGAQVATGARRVGYVAQDVLLFPHWTVRRNVECGAGRAGRADAARIERVLRVLELDGLVGRSVGSLSGGERQRTALARALCSEPDLLLFDEPLGALDRPLRRRILPYLLRAREEFGAPMVLVSHDPTEIEALCDEVCCLHEGRVVRQGVPAEVFAWDLGLRARGADLENVVRGRVRAVGEGTARLEMDGGWELVVPGAGLAVGERAVIAVRSDDVLVATERPRGLSARNVIAARVEAVVERGDEVLVRAAPADSRASAGGGAGPAPLLSVQLTPAALRELALAPGVAVHLLIKTRGCRVLSAVG